jgi:hypothetical protein
MTPFVTLLPNGDFFHGRKLYRKPKEAAMSEQTYRIRRNYFDSHWGCLTIETGLTLEEAQAHCRNPETSSRTATSAEAIRHTTERGAWFDGYEKE